MFVAFSSTQPGSLPVELPTLTRQQSAMSAVGSSSPRGGSSPVPPSPKTSPKETTNRGVIWRSSNPGKLRGPTAHPTNAIHTSLIGFSDFLGDFRGGKTGPLDLSMERMKDLGQKFKACPWMPATTVKSPG